MATSEINENCHYFQTDPHRCKIKLEKFHFDILRCRGVIKESLPGGAESATPGEIGLSVHSINSLSCASSKSHRRFHDTS